MAEQTDKKSPSGTYKNTLNLPHTEFSIRANHAVNDPKMIERWTQEQLFEKSFEHNKGAVKFILHDGPPYANGHIHLGTAYNKILKDIVCKARRMMGYHAPVIPGWDCHGLPIELKVTQEKPGLDRMMLKKACREYAQRWIDIQRTSFKKLGVLMNWDQPYVTMSPSYESATVRAFGQLVGNGFIERKSRTVPWCPHCQTVLASAEIEYENQKDPSLYFLFEFDKDDAVNLFPEIDDPIYAIVWTTTPWTVPLNQAILLHPTGDYVLAKIDDTHYILGKHALNEEAIVQGKKVTILREFPADFLHAAQAHHPFVPREVPFLFDDSVSLTEGTALVHIAPGAGPIDYEIGVKNNLDLISPISADGRFTSEVESKELVGMPTKEASEWVIKKLQDKQRLFAQGFIQHNYPHCWRCRSGLIFRATPQWFFNLDREGVQQRAIEATDTIKFVPPKGKNFLRATVASRWEWCLSRQRIWGVPIPALLCVACDHAYLDEKVVSIVADGVLQHGIEFWDTVSIEKLLPENFVCSECGGSKFKKETDILDVWFDSGISHYAVLYNNPDLDYPADLYLEGIDQHRGWFQSSLLTSLVLEGTPAMKSIFTHGYIVDSKGHKMSKSRGNVVAPQEIVDKIGTDGLRLWVASAAADSDPSVSQELLQNVEEVYRKIRNTCRFLISNLSDFDATQNTVTPDRLLPIDRYALTLLSHLNASVIDHYYHKDFTAIFHELADFCTVDMSSFYLDIVKDRLYTERQGGHLRRSAQTVLYLILDVLTRLMAPILSFTAEYVSDEYQKPKERSIHLQDFVDPDQLYKSAYEKAPSYIQSGFKHYFGKYDDASRAVRQKQKDELWDLQWNVLRGVRSVILKALEEKRKAGIIKHSLQAHVTLFINPDHEATKPLEELKKMLPMFTMTYQDLLKEILIVSQVTLAYDTSDLEEYAAGIFVSVEPASGNKCPRCWQWDVTAHPDYLCERCQRVLSSS